MERGDAEGLLIYGEGLDGFLPQERARTIQGADWETSLRFTVERRGDSYWAVWNARAQPAKPAVRKPDPEPDPD